MYIRDRLARALAKDLNIPLQELMDMMPPSREANIPQFKAEERLKPGPANTDENVY